MNITFSFNNGTPPVNQSFNNSGLLAFDLEVKLGSRKTRLKSLAGYIASLDYLFRGVVNQATSEILSTGIENSWYGTIKRDLTDVQWDCYVDRTFTIIYDMRRDVINERYYLADAITSNKDGIPVANKNLGLFNVPSSVMVSNITSAILVFNTYMKGYKLQWDDKEGLVLLDINGSIIDSEVVKDDEVYIILKLIAVILSKTVHMGVFFIDCTGFKENNLVLILSLIKELFDDTFVFMYNCSPNYQIPRNIVNLPNYVLREGAAIK